MADRPPRPGSMSDADRALAALTQRRNTPATGTVTTPWHEEHTGVHTDAQVFRALKSLHGELQANKAEAAKAHGALSARVTALDAKVSGIERTVTGFDQKLDQVAVSSAKTAGAVEVLANQRSRSPSGETRAVAEETLAKQVLADARDGRGFSRKVWLAIIAGAITFLTSGAFLHWVLSPKHAPPAEMRSAP